MERIATLPKPEGFFDPKQPAGRADAARARPESAAARSRRAARPALREHARLRELGPRVQRQPSLHGQLPRLQHLRHRAARSKPKLARLDRVPRRTGRRLGARQPARSCRCEQTRGRDRLRHAGRLRRRSAPSASAASAIFDITDIEQAEAGRRGADRAAARTRTRWSTTRTTPSNLYVYGSGTGAVRSGEELAGCSGCEPGGRSEHRALQHRRDPGAARGAAERADRQPAAHLRRPGDRRHRGLVAGRRSRRQGRRRRAITNQCHDITVYPEVGLAAGACSGNGILLDISDPKNPVRLDQRHGQELRLLALGDVQQRRHEGHLHRRVGRRHAAALPRRPIC